MTAFPYTDADLRHEAARQYAEILRSPDRAEVGDEMQGKPISSTAGDKPVRWHELSGDDFHDACNEVHQLLDSAVDVSAWSIRLGTCYLARTTDLAWGRGDCWDLAVQIAHRPRLADDFHDALVDAIRGAVRLVLDNRGIDCPAISQHVVQEATR